MKLTKKRIAEMDARLKEVFANDKSHTQKILEDLV